MTTKLRTRYGSRLTVQGGKFKGAQVDVTADHQEWVDEIGRYLTINAELLAALRAVVTHIPKIVLRKHGVVDRYPDGAMVDGGTQEFPRFVGEVAKARALLAKHAPKVTA